MKALDRMSCEEAVRRLDDYADRELTAAEARQVEEHLETCHRCLRRFEFERAMVADLRRKLQRVDVPPGLRARVLEALAG